MSKKIDLTGKIFGRLTVISEDKSGSRTKWICMCDCGKEKSIQATHLRNGASTSCGCYQKEKASEANATHGKSKTSIHNRWKAIKQRCLNPKNIKYKDYGGRNINICEEWLDFENFYNWAIGNGYSEELELDRINNDLGYFPNNC